MATLSVTEASRKAGVSRQTIYKQIRHGEIKRSSTGIDIEELLRVYPHLADTAWDNTIVSRTDELESPIESDRPSVSGDDGFEHGSEQTGKVELLVRELEWNKELLERTNELMARQLAEQRALIADQARRLDEKDRFWARQVEIAQSLLPPPAPRKKFLGLF